GVARLLMAARSVLPRLLDILEAAERIQCVVADATLERFEAECQRQWLVVSGLEIISEASRHLPDEVKERNPHIPWRNVADLGGSCWLQQVSRFYGRQAARFPMRSRKGSRTSYGARLSISSSCCATSTSASRRRSSGYLWRRICRNWRGRV